MRRRLKTAKPQQKSCVLESQLKPDGTVRVKKSHMPFLNGAAPPSRSHAPDRTPSQPACKHSCRAAPLNVSVLPATLSRGAPPPVNHDYRPSPRTQSEPRRSEVLRGGSMCDIWHHLVVKDPKKESLLLKWPGHLGGGHKLHVCSNVFVD